MVFPVVMYGCKSRAIKKAEHWRIDAFELWCWRRLLRVPWTARRSNQSILKEINPEYSLEGLKLKLQYFGHLMWRIDALEKTLMLGKIEGGRRRGRQDELVGWHHWCGGRESEWTPGVGDGQGGLACCCPRGRKVGHDWATELNWGGGWQSPSGQAEFYMPVGHWAFGYLLCAPEQGQSSRLALPPTRDGNGRQGEVQCEQEWRSTVEKSLQEDDTPPAKDHQGSAKRWGGQLRVAWRKPEASRGGMWSGCGLLLRGQEDEASKASVSWRAVLIVRAVSVVVVAESSFGFEVGEQQGERRAIWG